MVGAAVLVMLAFTASAEDAPQDPAADAAVAPAEDAPAQDAPAEEAPAEDAPAEDAPAQDAPPPTTTTPPTDACLALVKAHEQDAARDCYAKAGQDDVADLVGRLRLREPAQLEKPAGIDLGVLVRDGKAEMIGTSTLAGGYVAYLGVQALIFAANNGSGGVEAAALLLLAPVVGGVAGLGASTLAAVQVPAMTAGDANVIRAFTVLGGFNSILIPLDVNVAQGAFAEPVVVAGGMALIVVAGVGAGAGVAAATDLPEAAGSLALSAGLWATVGTLLVLDMGQVLKQRPQDSVFFITAAGNAGFAAGLLAAPFVPMTRAETWAIDVGGGVGLATGASIAVFARAPNPFIGWGSMLLGTGLGIAGGYSAAHFLPGALAALPDVVTVAPLVAPEPSTKTVAVGGALTGRF